MARARHRLSRTGTRALAQLDRAEVRGVDSLQALMARHAGGDLDARSAEWTVRVPLVVTASGRRER
jgi:hypothetical protein